MISILYIRRVDDDPEATILLNRIRTEGFHQLHTLTIEKAIRLEGISQEQSLTLKDLFCHPVNESLSSQSNLTQKDGPIIEVGYQRAVTDPELPSILRGAHALGIHDLIWARIAHRYQFQGIDNNMAMEIVNRYLYNPQVQIIIHKEDVWETLRPQGKTGPVEKIELNGLTDEELTELSERRRLFLNIDQMKTLQNIAHKMDRTLTDAEIEMFAQTWSDHCFHTTWKSLGLLQMLFNATLEMNHPLVLSAFEDNAGAMTFYADWALTIKGETHNSPTAVSPYGGIMTKHGGVIRDTLGCGQGAWPIGGSTVMGLGIPFMTWEDLPKATLHPKTILLESIRGTADYNNPMGIPMMFPIYRFHSGYTGKCFALGHSIGLIPAKRSSKGHPQPGDFAVLIGGSTGRDGLHGATVSSDSMTDQTSTTDASHVQIGHPIEERKFMEAIPVLRDRDCLRAITDLGAAGLSSAAGEMGSETGIWINLAWVPLKTEGLHPWEIWISESQERMLLCVSPEKINEALSILEKFEVASSIVGRFTQINRCQVVYDPTIQNQLADFPDTSKQHGNQVVDLDFKDLRKSCPLPKIKLQKPKKRLSDYQLTPLKSKTEWRSCIESVLSHVNICDQSVAGTQFDNTVQGMTVIGPYGGLNGKMPNDIWASVPIRGKPYGAISAIGFNPLYGEVDPVCMAKLTVLESVTKLIAAGVDSGDIVLCDNFYTPRITPEVAWTLKEMVTLCANLSQQLGIPFISGKDSSSGTFIDEDGNRIDVPPTLCILALGRMPDVNVLIPKSWQEEGNQLLLVGPVSSELGGSIYLNQLGESGNALPDPPVADVQNTWKYLKKLQHEKIILSASAVAEGGILRRIFEMAMGSGLGCQVYLSELKSQLKTDLPEIGLFAEMTGSVILETRKEDAEIIMNQYGAIPIGQIIREPELVIKTNDGTLHAPMDELIDIWKKPFPEVAK